MHIFLNVVFDDIKNEKQFLYLALFVGQTILVSACLFGGLSSSYGPQQLLFFLSQVADCWTPSVAISPILS